MMKAGDIVHLCGYLGDYDNAKIESVSTHSETGYKFTHPIARVFTMDGEFIGSYMEHDFEMKDGELWELGD